MCKIQKYLIALGMLMAMIYGNLFASLIVTTLDHVYVTSEGLYVNLDGNPQPVESLTLANNGYVIASALPMAACPRCGCERYVSGRLCPVCNFPDDGDDFQANNS